MIVEGADDQKLFGKLLDGPHVQIEPSHAGLTGVLAIVKALRPETGRVIGIRDADFLHLEGKAEEAEQIFVTDCHDAEMMIAACEPAYRQVAGEYLGEERRRAFPREKILASIAFIGGLRWLNHTDDLQLNFDRLGLGDWYRLETPDSDTSNSDAPGSERLSLDESGFLGVILRATE
ncbi:MAG: Protein of unknown function (DUF4435) [Candidatus Kentron sp. G]|nr:MAG: Protein of unknown function (DUF4435) [Candidatus Kentron sp. G]VFN07903.1 MAG: Protein of unknown function (DUF4435) [Candidatus Kentron sp. G]